MNNKTKVIAQEIPLAQIVFDRIHPANRIENDTVLALKKHFQITKDNVLAVIPVEGTDYFRPLDDTVNKDKIANKLTALCEAFGLHHRVKCLIYPIGTDFFGAKIEAINENQQHHKNNLSCVNVDEHEFHLKILIKHMIEHEAQGGMLLVDKAKAVLKIKQLHEAVVGKKVSTYNFYQYLSASGLKLRFWQVSLYQKLGGCYA